MTLTIRWFDRDTKTFLPIYDQEHHGTIHGENAAECMSLYNQWKQNHDVYNYTVSEIVYVSD